MDGDMTTWTGAAAQDLAEDLMRSPQTDYVRVAADWMTRAGDVSAAADLTGDRLIDALVAAAAAYVALRRGGPEPSWCVGRSLDTFWHPGPAAFLAWSFAHAPGAFKCRGLLVEEESLMSV